MHDQGRPAGASLLGLSEVEADEGWWVEPNGASLHEQVYATLARMVRMKCRVGPDRLPERAGDVLFEGGGNWGMPGDPSSGPAHPHFTSCRLTVEGQRLARALLKQSLQAEAASGHVESESS